MTVRDKILVKKLHSLIIVVWVTFAVVSLFRGGMQ